MFITDSAKRDDLLRYTASKHYDSDVKHKLIKLCQMRFVEPHVAFERFWEQTSDIAIALQLMTSWKDKRASSKATIQLNSLLTTEFIVGVRVMKCLAAILRPLSLGLQEKGLDLTSALGKITAVESVLKNMRENAVLEFSLIFAEVESMARQTWF